MKGTALFALALMGTASWDSAAWTEKWQRLVALQVSNTPDLLQPEELDSITLERTVYFFKPGGGYVVASPGLYLVRLREDSQLLLIPQQGRQTLSVQAQSTRHQDQLQEPVALSVPEKESLLHLLLLLPGGGGLEAVGAFTPVHLRSGEISTLSPEELRQALAKKSAALVPQ